MLRRVSRWVSAAMVATVCTSWVSPASGVDIETVPVGNPGNPADTHDDGYGAVDYEFHIGMYEVTAGQYAEFLNAVAATDTYGLYNTNMWSSSFGCKIQRTGSAGSYRYSVADNRADRPVNYVSWGDAARFANWLHNDQRTGAQNLTTTEDGAYFLDGATGDEALLAVEREKDWTWAVPTENEWYKAAYHKNDGVTGNYFDWPTRSDTRPSNRLVNPDPGNNATFCTVIGVSDPPSGDYTIGSPYYRTEVGAHENSDSPYGTFDQGGNVWEWNEAVTENRFDEDAFRGLRGGSYGVFDLWIHGHGASLHAAGRDDFMPTYESDSIGFRVVAVPEPGSAAFLVLGTLAIVRRRSRRDHAPMR